MIRTTAGVRMHLMDGLGAATIADEDGRRAADERVLGDIYIAAGLTGATFLFYPHELPDRRTTTFRPTRSGRLYLTYFLDDEPVGRGEPFGIAAGMDYTVSWNAYEVMA